MEDSSQRVSSDEYVDSPTQGGTILSLVLGNKADQMTGFKIVMNKFMSRP